MPFAKWNLEPVYVSRTPPWHGHQGPPPPSSGKHGASNGGPACSKAGGTVTLPPFSLPMPPPPASTTTPTSPPPQSPSATIVKQKENVSPNVPNGRGRTTRTSTSPPKESSLVRHHHPPVDHPSSPVLDSQSTESRSLLLKIHTRTLVSVIRQMSALLGASDQLFAELTEEIRRLADRSLAVKGRVLRLSGDIDRANCAIRQKPPRIASILDEMCCLEGTFLDGTTVKCHWKSTHPLDRNLLCPETRPLSVRSVYARAHAPGDLRLASAYYGQRAGYPSPFVTMLRLRRPTQNGQNQQNRRSAPNNPNPRNSTLISCSCSCGQCHGRALSEPPEALAEDEVHAVQNAHPTVNRTSSPSSLVTWSSVVSSSAFADSSVAVAVGGGHQSHAPLNRRSTLLSSFSSADYGEEASTDPKTKIDDFFRKNNVPFGTARHQTMPPTVASKCTCSCSETPSRGPSASRHHHQHLTSDDPMTSMTDLYSQVDSQISSSSVADHGGNSQELQHPTRNVAPGTSSRSIHDPDSYWNWWWSDDEHRRWSSAMTSPLKPAKTDDMAVWMRENIETRRPESVVFKSSSDVPDHILLERALSPPCSSHSIQLRPKKSVTQSEAEPDGNETDSSSTLPRLKRRWSLFSLRRRKRHQSSPAVRELEISSPTPVLLSQPTTQFFNRFNRNYASLSPENRLKSGIDTQSTGESPEEGGNPTEVFLMSPEERTKLIASQNGVPTVVNIDVSGRTFNRLTAGRRSLIHSDFHIPRRHVHGRSRSKSPVKTAAAGPAARNSHEVSPYALSGKLPDTRRPMTETGCQTEDCRGARNNKAPVNKSATLDRNDRRRQGATNNGGGTSQCQVAVEVHREPRYSPLHDDFHLFRASGGLRPKPSSVGGGAPPEDEEDDDYVMLRKAPRPYGARYENNGDALEGCTTSSTADSVSDVGWRCTATATPAVTAPSSSVDTKSESNQTITLRYRAYDQAAKSRRQNGGRSSSGNWSAATSDLLQSSSTSSSPLHLTAESANTASGSSKPAKKYSLKSMSHQEPLNGGPLKNGAHVDMATSTNDEAESVYSVDNDGYFTSMHTDSGLFFGHTPLVELTSAPVGAKSGAPLGVKAKRSLLDGKLKRFERITEEPGSLKNLAVSEAVPASQNPTFGGSNESINSILSASDATSVAIDGTELLSPLDDTASSFADFDCSVSHCSHQFTNGHAHTAPHLGHRAHYRVNLEEKRRMTAEAIRMMHQHHRPADNRLRTVSGTFAGDDEEDDETLRSSSSETLHTIDETASSGPGRQAHYDTERRTRVKKSGSYRSATYGSLGSSARSATLNYPKVSGSEKTLTPSRSQSNSLRRQISNLTESSSASSSCRKMPPPPPPPRVSSMLQTLQQYRSDDERAKKDGKLARRSFETDPETEDLDSLVGSSVRNSLACEGLTAPSESVYSAASSLGAYRYAPRPQSGSETNSEYLRGQVERRRRLFLDVVDSARSYPPLSYIPDTYDTQAEEEEEETDTVSLASSAGTFVEHDTDTEVADSLRNLVEKVKSETAESEDGTLTQCTSTTHTAASSRTITPIQEEETAAEQPLRQEMISSTAVNCGTLERKKQLEERHLSSPLPPPKLASFVRIKAEKQPNQEKGASPPKSSAPASPPKPKPRNSLHFTTPPNLESFSKETEAVSQARETPLTPKSPGVKSVTINLPSPRGSPRTGRKPSTTSSSSVSPQSSSSSASPQVSPSSVSGAQPSGNRLTTQDLLIILHNQKKKHNIKTEPEIYASTRSPPARTASPASPQPLSPPGTRAPSTGVTNPTYGQLSSAVAPLSPTSSSTMPARSRRSWTGNDSALSPNKLMGPTSPNGTSGGSNAPRTRQSLALDRLGPLRPTTLTDFKKLLANVRPPSNSTTTVPAATVISPGSSACSSLTGTPVSSTYTALQQILKGGAQTPSDPPSVSSSSNTQSTSSGVSSLLSPTSQRTSPFSPLSSSAASSPFSSPVRKASVTPSPLVSPLSPTGTHSSSASMNSFIKKFSKSKFLASNGSAGVGALGSERARSAVARLEAALTTCPPIPEDPIDGSPTPAPAESSPSQEPGPVKGPGKAPTKCTGECGDALANSGLKHNCTSTWV